MRTTVYVDGFNLYYGALRHTKYRWLDLAQLCARLLPRDSIQQIRYYTARIIPRSSNPSARTRQDIYLRALNSLANVSIHEGHFLSHTVAMPLAADPRRMVQVIRTEEKGSDVNLASHLLRDAYKDRFELGIVLSNDSDLLEPIRIVQHDLSNPIGVLNPQSRPSRVLLEEATFFKSIRSSALRASQFPPMLRDASGLIRKPKSW